MTRPLRIQAPSGLSEAEFRRWARDTAEWAAEWGFLDVLAEAVNELRATDTRPQHVVRDEVAEGVE